MCNYSSDKNWISACQAVRINLQRDDQNLNGLRENPNQVFKTQVILFQKTKGHWKCIGRDFILTKGKMIISKIMTVFVLTSLRRFICHLHQQGHLLTFWQRNRPLITPRSPGGHTRPSYGRIVQLNTPTFPFLRGSLFIWN